MTLSMGGRKRGAPASLRRSRTGEKMIMHLPRLVAAPGDEPGRRRYRSACLGIKIAAGIKARDSGGKKPGPGIVVKGRVGEDDVEHAALRHQQRPRVPDVRFERACSEH